VRNSVSSVSTKLVVATLCTFGIPMVKAYAASSSSIVAPGTPLTNTALDGYSEIGQIDILSPTLGYALAIHPEPGGRYAYYLVRSTNLARTWTVIGALPLPQANYPVLSSFNSGASDPAIDFANRSIGYVSSSNGPIYVTTDAGSTWRRVVTPGRSPTYGVNSAELTVVSGHCSPTGSTAFNPTCRNLLSVYRLGATTASRTEAIPVRKAAGTGTVALLATTPDSIDVVNINSGDTSTPTSLLDTRDDGVRWQPLPNPCAGLPIEELLVGAHDQWLLSCFLDQGMGQGTAKLFRSTDRGASWATVLNLPDPPTTPGGQVGTGVYYFISGNGRILYGAFTNAAGGLTVSTDGGRQWTRSYSLGSTGGSPESISTFGPTSAIYQVYGGPMFITRDSVNWRLLPELPAGKYRGLSICTSAKVDASLRHVKYGGLTYGFIDFTNHGSAACYLDEAPNIQPLDAAGQPVGPPGTTETFDNSGDFVVLRARGGVANLAFSGGDAGSYHPASSCLAEAAHSVQIDFGSPSAFRLTFTTKPLSTCTKFSSLFITTIRTGRGKP
jgi:photosystem II stability/assembly factor-like uncharacterized protein